MKTINLKCTNDDSFKYSILISLHYYDLNSHKERINRLNKYIKNYNFKSNNPTDFEINNPYISLTIYDEHNKIVYKPLNKSNNKAYALKINNKYYALKPDIDKFMQLKQLLIYIKQCYSRSTLMLHLLFSIYGLISFVHLRMLP